MLRLFKRKPTASCNDGVCLLVDDDAEIPSSQQVADEIDRHVTQPNKELAEKIAAWAVKAYREKIAREHVSGGTIIPFPWDRSAWSVEVQIIVDGILCKKGWHVSHNFVTNTMFIMPTEPRDRVVYGPAPGY